jgi:hypothetical protein
MFSPWTRAPNGADAPGEGQDSSQSILQQSVGDPLVFTPGVTARLVKQKNQIGFGVGLVEVGVYFDAICGGERDFLRLGAGGCE